MDQFLQQDLFFFITSAVTLLLAVLVAVLIIYLINISRKVNYIVKRVKEQTDLIAEDVSELRANIKTSGAGLKSLLGIFFRGKKRSK